MPDSIYDPSQGHFLSWGLDQKTGFCFLRGYDYNIPQVASRVKRPTVRP